MATEIYELKQHLKKLIGAVDAHLTAMDNIMQGPSTPERGKQIALLCNHLDFRKDIAKRYGLGVGLPKPTKRTTRKAGAK